MEQFSYVSVLYRLIIIGGAIDEGHDISEFFYPVYDVEKQIFIPVASNLITYEPNIQYSPYAENPIRDSAERTLSKDGSDIDIGDSEYITLPVGTYTLTYTYTGSMPISSNEYTLTYQYIFSVVQNRLPLKKWTITDVIDRTCDLIEPLKFGQKPRFRFDGVEYDDTTGNAITYTAGSQAEAYDKIISPEFAFTKMTFREQMQKVGGYIHGEFRVTRIERENNQYVFYFAFDEYGGTKKINASARIKNGYIYSAFNIDVNDYCTALDSSAENLINQLDWAQGVIIDPYNSGYIGLRAENTTTRLMDDNSTVIPTIKPIHHFGANGKLLAQFTWQNQTYTCDITQYLFEKADYDLLSSYSGTYPYCKAYALYYTVGEKNIKGLFFKSPHAVSGIFSRYAIINILRAASGIDNLFDDLAVDSEELKAISFQIQYIPIYNERIKTNKSIIISGFPRSLAYNQSANIIESRYYGEHLKGVIARIGNVAKTYTYYLAFLSDVPKAGMLFDQDYYISTVATEFLPDKIKCTIGLSKDFNRLSQYIGINSEMRMWEVSEKQAVERDTIITEYLVFNTEYMGLSDNDTLFNYRGGGVLNAFNVVEAPISAAQIVRLTKDLTMLTPAVTLPVIAVASGNSMLFTFSFADNYSAGQTVQWVEGETGGVSGLWTNYSRYGDNYGRFYYIAIKLCADNVNIEQPANSSIALKFPNIETVDDEVHNGGVVTHNRTVIGNRSINNNPTDRQYLLKYRKDSREVPQITYSLTAISKTEKLIIGSGMMKNCQYVNSMPRNIYLAFFTSEISPVNSIPDVSKIDPQILGTIKIELSEIQLSVHTGRTYKAWAILTVPEVTDARVEDEDGNTTTERIISGNELIIGGNGELPEKIYMTIRKNIYA